MARLLSSLRSWFKPVVDDQRDTLVITRFEGVCNAYEQMQNRLPIEWVHSGVSGTTSQASERAMVFYALASARMQLAEQFHAAFLEDKKSPTYRHSSQARIDLEELITQIDVLTLATQTELAQANSTQGDWEVKHQLQEIINPPLLSKREEDTPAHVQAVYNGEMILLARLQSQFQVRQQSTDPLLHSNAGVFLSGAQHTFDTLRPLAAELSVKPERFGVQNSPLHEVLEERLRPVIGLLENAAAELAVPGVTKTSLWNDLVGKPQAAFARSPIAGQFSSGEQPWKHDIWCMTSELFKQNNSKDARAKRVVKKMWEADPDPATTWALYKAVLILEQQGAVRTTQSYYNACPWADVWHANKTVRVGDKLVQAGKEFSLHVEAESDGSYARQVIIADFVPTNELDYCDNESPRRHGHHGD